MSASSANAFAADPAGTLARLYRFAGVTVPDAVVAGIARSPVFASDAKTDADFAVKAARDEAATRSAVTEDEIAKVTE